MNNTKWTGEDAKRAYGEGWGLHDTRRDGKDVKELQRVDEFDEITDTPTIFNSDEVAFEFVFHCAINGSRFHHKALVELMKSNPKEFMYFGKELDKYKQSIKEI